jgi:hypothetical protein
VSADLVKRWIDAVKPFDVERALASMSDQYAKHLGWSDEMKASAKKALLSIDMPKLIERISMFAEENFSDEVLAEAVEFFESPAGRTYLLQRKVVSAGVESLIAKQIAEGIKREFGI